MINVSRLLTVFRREMAAYFNSAIAYIFIIVFIILNGGLFMTQFFLIGMADMRTFFEMLPFVLSIFLPAVTMRLWAEERRGNTLELLLTFPMETRELVLGKFLASLVFYLSALVSTLPLPIMICLLGRPDFGMIMGGYLGAILLGSFFLAIGIFISGLCRDQIVAFILAMIICYGLHLTGTEYIASSIDGWLPGLGTLLRSHVGSASHFESFGKGVLDNRDALYFLLGTGIFLVLNGFWLEGRMRPNAKKIFTTAVTACVGIFFLSNWLLAGIPIGRFDLTQGKIYTISKATKKILRALEAPVNVKFYVSPSDKMPTGMKSLEQDVVDKLDEFVVASKGNFRYKIFHMEAANVVEGAESGKNGGSLEEQLQQKGIQPFQVRAIVSDEVAVRLVYASLSVSYKDKPDEVIPRVIPDTIHELEYTVISKIYRMTLDEEPKVALMAPYEEKSVPKGMQALLAQLGGGRVPPQYRDDKFELVGLALSYEGFPAERIRLSESEPIPQGTKTLVILDPEKLSDRQDYEINKFLYQGGSVFLAVQQHEYDYSVAGSRLNIMPRGKDSGVNALTKPWGFEVDDSILLDEEHDIINLSGGSSMGPFDLTVPVKLPLHIRIIQSGMNQNVSITSHLSPLVYLWGTALKIDSKKVAEQKLKVETLFSSSARSWKIPFRQDPIRPKDLNKTLSSENGPFPLAVLVRGQFENTFHNQVVPAWPETETSEEEPQAKKPESKSEQSENLTAAPGQLLLVGDARMFDRELVQGAGHLPFFLNSINAITLGEDLVTIRSKQPINRSLGHVSTATKVWWRFFVTIFIPALIAAAGAMRMFMRSRSKRNYLKALLIHTP